jgi:hypothetical protein
LQKDFGDYVRSKHEGSVVLCNQHLEIMSSLILMRAPPNPTTKFGSGWKHFCRLSGYKEGDKIRFKFGSPHNHDLIHVLKL